MKLLITGTPGTGKSKAGAALAKLLGIKRVINEKEFALACGLGKWDKETDELVVAPGKLATELNKELAKRSGNNIIIEGHILCEARLNVDVVIVLRTHPEILEARLEKRGYHAEKVQDNVFCEGIDYCKKHVLKRYAKKKVVELYVKGSAKETAKAVKEILEERGLL